MAAGLSAQPALKTEASATGEAYRTLVKAAKSYHPDLTKDPVWATTDHVMADHDLLVQDFAECTSTTVFKDTNFSARRSEYKSNTTAIDAVSPLLDAKPRRLRLGPSNHSYWCYSA